MFSRNRESTWIVEIPAQSNTQLVRFLTLTCAALARESTWLSSYQYDEDRQRIALTAKKPYTFVNSQGGTQLKHPDTAPSANTITITLATLLNTQPEKPEEIVGLLKEVSPYEQFLFLCSVLKEIQS